MMKLGSTRAWPGLPLLPIAGALLCAFTGCGPAERSAAIGEIDRVLDDWHQAASVADRSRYIGHLAADAVFLGTDAKERWTVAEFDRFVAPYFDKGQGWIYPPVA